MRRVVPPPFAVPEDARHGQADEVTRSRPPCPAAGGSPLRPTPAGPPRPPLAARSGHRPDPRGRSALRAGIAGLPGRSGLAAAAVSAVVCLRGPPGAGAAAAVARATGGTTSAGGGIMVHVEFSPVGSRDALEIISVPTLAE